jgi:type III secretion protein C
VEKSTVILQALRSFCHAVLSVAALSMALVCASTAWASSLPWVEAPFSYYTANKPLKTVLQEFAAGFSLSTDLPPDLNDVVSGRFNVNNPSEFLDRLAGTFGFTWFTYSGTLYVSFNKDMVVRSILTNTSGVPSNLRQVMTNLGLLNPRFGWGELPEQGVVVISGPPAYVRLIESTIAALPSAPGGQQITLFRLKHASVDDRVITFRDRQITTPGVANILRNLVMGSTSQSGLRIIPSPLAQSETELNANSETGANSRAPTTARAEGTNATQPFNTARSKPSIQSDSRINAIIVQDSPDRMPMYKQIIAQLDVPTPLIEIEALIIDVNTSRLSELGISWGAVGNGQRAALGFGNVGAAADSKTISFVASGATGVNPSTIIASGADYFVARLRALEQQGDASIQSRPSIMTTENLGAVIDLSETFYLQTTSERSTLVTPITAGITLRVTPRLVGTGDNLKVRLSVDIEDGQIKQATTVGGVPSVIRGVVSTEASVYQHETLLIGGYNSIQSVKGTDKVPMLGDLPLLGPMFRTASDSVQRRERLFLIRSKVLRSTAPDELPAATSIAPAVPVVAAADAATPEGGAATVTEKPKVRVFDVNTLGTQNAPAGTESVRSPVAAYLGAPGTTMVPPIAPTAPRKVRIDASVQQARDRQARAILEDEMAREEAALQLLLESNKQETDWKAMADTDRQIAQRQADIAAIQRELSRLRRAP